MAREELDACQARQPELEEQIKLLLVPTDPQDGRNAILEIRGGTGGDEAAIFAGDLFPHVHQVLRIQGMENGDIQRQRRCGRRFQGNCLLRDGRQRIRHAEI